MSFFYCLLNVKLLFHFLILLDGNMTTIGIVGFGVVGLAGLRLFTSRPELLKKFLNISSQESILFIIRDKKDLPLEYFQFFSLHGIRWVKEADCSLAEFFLQVDHALISPGINLRDVENQRHKFFCELDFFQYGFDGSSIGITGSLGKTTVTKLIYSIFNRFNQERKLSDSVFLGGNVGIGMLDVLNAPHSDSWAVLELSSFQLEYSFKFAPKIGIWTNLYPNHLDRHGSMSEYFESKAHLFMQQSPDSFMILGTQLFDKNIVEYTTKLLHKVASKLIIAGCDSLSPQIMREIPRDECIVWTVENDYLSKHVFLNRVLISSQAIVFLSSLPAFTFRDNWAVVFAALDVAGVDIAWLVEDLQTYPKKYVLQDSYHRLEFVMRSESGIDFYNDSKSTVKEATLAAVTQLALTYDEIHVIIGGLSKGVSRADFGALLSQISQVKNIVAFGAEATNLGAKTVVATMEEALSYVFSNAKAGSAVLFSPGGASFDLFKNYEQRGDNFKELVISLCK